MVIQRWYTKGDIAPVETSLTLRDTRKEFQNPWVTKTYSVGFKHRVELSYKKRIQKI